MNAVSNVTSTIAGIWRLQSATQTHSRQNAVQNPKTLSGTIMTGTANLLRLGQIQAGIRRHMRQNTAKQQVNANTSAIQTTLGKAANA